MANDYFYTPSKNAIQKTLGAQLLNTASTGDAISLSDVDGIQNKPGVLVINRVDSNGTATPSAREYISFTGTSGSTVLIDTRNVDNSTSAKTHAVGSVVEFIPDVVWAQRLIDQALVEHNVDGTHDSATVTTLKATQAEVATGTEDAKIVTPLAAAPYGNSSMSRQAIMNGNFDVWQRGTSVALADVTPTFQADRFLDYTTKDGGTLPTLTRSRQAITAGSVPNSFYCSRLASNGAGTSLGVNSYHQYVERIEHGTRMLCGLNKKVTVSFYAKSDIANKKIGISLQQNYGTGGSPSTAEIISGTSWTLTSTWTKYTYTFTTNTLVGKTFGTANDDMLIPTFWHMWGDTIGDGFGLTGAETYGGSGFTDIAQVQLCAGDVALPFQPKSFEEELRACQRYYEVGSQNSGWSGNTVSGTVYLSSTQFSVSKRATPPTMTWVSNSTVNGFPNSTVTFARNTQTGFDASLTSNGNVNGGYFFFNWTADAEL